MRVTHFGYCGFLRQNQKPLQLVLAELRIIAHPNRVKLNFFPQNRKSFATVLA